MDTKGKYFYGNHKPSGESWVILGICASRDSACAAGYPPTMAKLSDITELECAGDLTPEMLNYREKQFGTNWDN